MEESISLTEIAAEPEQPAAIDSPAAKKQIGKPPGKGLPKRLQKARKPKTEGSKLREAKKATQADSPRPTEGNDSLQCTAIADAQIETAALLDQQSVLMSVTEPVEQEQLSADSRLPYSSGNEEGKQAAAVKFQEKDTNALTDVNIPDAVEAEKGTGLNQAQEDRLRPRAHSPLHAAETRSPRVKRWLETSTLKSVAASAAVSDVNVLRDVGEESLTAVVERESPTGDHSSHIVIDPPDKGDIEAASMELDEALQLGPSGWKSGGA